MAYLLDERLVGCASSCVPSKSTEFRGCKVIVPQIRERNDRQLASHFTNMLLRMALHGLLAVWWLWVARLAAVVVSCRYLPERNHVTL